MAGDPIEYAGIDVLILQPETKLITKAYSEWNNGELLYDLGDRVCFQKGNASACSQGEWRPRVENLGAIHVHSLQEGERNYIQQLKRHLCRKESIQCEIQLGDQELAH